MIDTTKLTVTNGIFDDVMYRGIHRVKMEHDENWKIMLSRRYKRITLHWFNDEGIFIKHPKSAQNEKEASRLIRYAYKEMAISDRILSTLRDTSISLGILYLVLDKIAVECQLSAKNLKVIMRQLSEKILYTRLDVIQYFSQFLVRDRVTKEIEPILNRLDGYIREFPAVHSYEPQLYLADYKFSHATQARIPRISYTDFLDTISDFTDDEVLEMVGNYKVLTDYEETKNIREILYKLTQRFK